ncbi:hypothetical protein B6N60_04861 [Richelia sinica FACHB-800]|uniref:Uncharacterized protein n=1 Tax=Richelia sinica FACHB-800 TaxID=1357546 RepID=A0A975Y7A3_9NOST|nr:hypothetical protein B6N60_04861 [Richelia sinica FACHB-800]
MREETTVKVKVDVWNVAFLSWYRNIIEVQPVDHQFLVI